MGIDITCFAEMRVNGVWKLAETLQENRLWDAEHPELETRLEPQFITTTRNRALFAILANVSKPMLAERPFHYISLPRGIPEDTSQEARDYYNHWKGDVFSASWILLAELLAFDWTQIIRRQAMVEKSIAALFTPEPQSFPYDQWPDDIPISYGEYISGGVTVYWRETYRDAVGPELFKDIIPKLQSYGQADEVRIVFWFDA
jgi:hypothetical protein